MLELTLFLFLLPPAPAGLGVEILADNLEVLKENPFLRDRFRSVYCGDPIPYIAPYYKNDLEIENCLEGGNPIVEVQVDRAVKGFVRGVSRKLERVKSTYLEIDRTYRQRNPTGPASQSPRENLAKTLKTLASETQKLRSSLAFVFDDLNSSCDYSPDPDPTDMAREIAFMGEEIGEAEQRIQQSVFASKATISVQELQKGNMMVHLHRVQKMAGLLARRLQNKP